MQFRLECYEHEKDQAVAALSNGFRIKSVSKAYPNTRRTCIEGTPCENRYYIAVDGVCSDVRDMLTIDMLRFLAWVSNAFDLDMSGEVDGIRRFYDGCNGLTAQQKTALALEWKSGLMNRLLPVMKGGAKHA